MGWSRIAPPYEFFQIAAWKDDNNPNIKVVIEQQSGPDVRGWEMNLVDESGEAVSVETINTFENEEDARQAGERFTSEDNE